MPAKKPFAIKLEQRVLWVAAQGLWTSTTAEQYVQEFRRLVKPIIAEPWALVLDIRHWQICPADVLQRCVENTEWCYQHHLAHVETIYADNSMVLWQFAKATTATKPEQLVSQAAADEQAARLALLRAGFLW